MLKVRGGELPVEEKDLKPVDLEMVVAALKAVTAMSVTREQIDSLQRMFPSIWRV